MSDTLRLPSIKEPYNCTTTEFDDFIEEVRSLEPLGVSTRLKELKEASRQDMSICPDYLALGTAVLILQAQTVAESLQDSLEKTDESATIYVVQPVFNEAERMSPRSDSNPHGENALLYRLERFAAITNRCPLIRFNLIVIDDGCDGKGDPSKISSQVAMRLLQEAPDEVKAEVVLLDDLIQDADSLQWNPRMTSSRDSRKGGSVIGGFAYARTLAARLNTPSRQAFVDTDADLSIHPDQIMLVSEPILTDKADAAIASRRVDGAVACIDPARDKRGQNFIKQWQASLPELARHVTDVNRGLKAFSKEAVGILIADVLERTFAYQIESLNALVAKGKTILEVPVSYIDSVSLSTQSGDAPAQTYTDLLERVRAIAKR